MNYESDMYRCRSFGLATLDCDVDDLDRKGVYSEERINISKIVSVCTWVIPVDRYVKSL